jgi:molybdate transport system substrate-binding protein
MKIGAFTATAKLAFVFLLAQSLAAQAAEVKLLSAAGFRGVMNELAPQFERTTSHKVVGTFDSTGALRRQIDGGESFDVVMLAPEVIDDLIKQGKVASGTRVDVARAGLGVAVRAGAAKPDIASVDGFKRALIGAKSVSYVGEGLSGAYFVGLLDRLGIAEQMKPKLKPMAVADVNKAGASGEAELVVHLIPGMQGAPGIDLVGPLPAELQTYIGFSAGLGSTAKEPEAAKALINFLKSEAAVPAIKAKGLETAAR